MNETPKSHTRGNSTQPNETTSAKIRRETDETIAAREEEENFIADCERRNNEN